MHGLLKQAEINWIYHHPFFHLPNGGDRILNRLPTSNERFRALEGLLTQTEQRALRDRLRNPGDAVMDPRRNEFNRRYFKPNSPAIKAHQAFADRLPLKVYLNIPGGPKDLKEVAYPGSYKITKGPSKTPRSPRSPGLQTKGGRKLFAKLHSSASTPINYGAKSSVGKLISLLTKLKRH